MDENGAYFGKPCTKCGKPVDHMWFSHRQCKACNSKTVSARYDPDRARQLNARRKYGVDLSAMLKAQPNCGICGSRLIVGNKINPKGFAIDHCHRSEKVRGLLCNACNRGLGLLQDSRELLKKAIVWLDTADLI